jgi:hypothetical protein
LERETMPQSTNHAATSQPYRYCDGLARRSFLRIGGLALGGLGLVDLLRAEETAGKRSSWSTCRAGFRTTIRLI